jgi:DNA topoisomerase-1
VLGPHPRTEAEIKLMEGRFGPYVTDGTTNATLPKSLAPDALTLEEAAQLIDERAAKGAPAKKGRGRKAAPKAAAAKKADGKNAAPKKAAAKKPGAKKPGAKKPAAKNAAATKAGGGD